jgi:hypothetical protein
MEVQFFWSKSNLNKAGGVTQTHILSFGWLNRVSRLHRTTVAKDENGRKISRTEPYRFLYLIRSNLYFFVRLYCFRFRISDVLYFICKSRKRFRYFPTVFYFSTFNLKYSEFKIGQLHRSYNPITGCSSRSCVLSTGGQLSSLIDGAQPHLPSPHEMVLNGRKSAASTRKSTWAIAHQAHRFNPHL